MTFLQWRRFNFFEKKFLSNTADHPLTELAKSCQITCSSSGNGSLIFGDISGLIYLVGRQHTITSFSAYKIAVTHCCAINNRYSTPNSAANSLQSNSKFYIVTVGTDTENLVPILKIWSIDESTISLLAKTAVDTNSDVFPTNLTTDSNPINVSNTSNEQSANPFQTCIRSIKLCQNTSNLAKLKVHASVTVLDVLDDTMIAVGFNDGNCLVIKGDLTRDKNIRIQLLEVSPDSSTITGLTFSSYTKTANQQLNKGFRAFSSAVPNTKQHIILFVSTRDEICSFDLSSKNKEAKLVLDSFGCDISCSCLKRDPKQFESIQYIVGRNDAIYFYNIDGRGPCLAFDGKKLFLYWFRNYLVAITLNDITRVNNNQPNNPNAPSSESPSSHTLLTNPNTNLITIYDIARKFIAFSCPIPSVNQVVSEWGNLYIITTDGRICMFTECDTQTKLELLFRKNQFSLAIDLAKSQTYSQDYLADMFKQYGDHLYRTGDYDGAISQYCQTIGILEPSYVIRKFLDLQRIHNLTLYLQELHKRGLATEDHTTLLINCYVKLKDEQKLNEFLRSSDIVFDVDIAIRVLRQADFYDNAILLAKRHGLFDSYFSILLEDKTDSMTVLETFQELLKDSKHEIVSQYLSKYGRLLMADEPDKTTDLLKSLCSHIFRQPRDNSRPSNQNPNKSSEFLFDMNDLATSLNDDSLNLEFKPEKYLHIFLNHSSKLIEFLEFLINESKSDRNPYELSFEISNTLLEIYLHSYKNEIKEDGLAENETKIMNFLKNENSNYDFKKAMILCQMSNFMPGVLYLYEKTRMFKQILAHSISQNDSKSVIEICNKFGEEEPNLWVDALWYFSEVYDDNCQTDTLLVLEKIEKYQLLPPLMVVEILSKFGKVTLGAVRDFLMRWIETEQRQIDDNEKLIESYRQECEAIRLQIKDIKSKPRIFQASKCAACSHALELPTIHFMCGHSYHHHCFESYVAENDRDCPLCLPENRKILNEISLLDNVNNVNDLFQQELLETSDPFDVIARYCSQGLFNPLTVVTDDGLIQSQSQQNQNIF